MDLGNRLNWNLLRRQNYKAQIFHSTEFEYDYLAIRDVQIAARSPILMVGVSSSVAKSHWKTGAWVSMWLPVLPASTTQFTATVSAHIHRCQLRHLNLVQFPYLGISPYIVNVSFPYWLEEVDLEMWQYGESMDGTYEPPNTELYKVAESLARIEAGNLGGNRNFNLEIIDEP